MGWCNGSFLAERLWDEMREFVPDKRKKEMAKIIYEMFCDEDADCWEGTSQLEKDMRRKKAPVV